VVGPTKIGSIHIKWIKPGKLGEMMKYASYIVNVITTDEHGNLPDAGQFKTILDKELDRYRNPAMTVESVEIRRTNGNNPFWTIAYRTGTDPYFHRVNDWNGTWEQAYAKSGEFAHSHPDYSIYYIPTRDAEMAGYGDKEDIGNILLDNGQRVHIVDDGSINAE
jgi:hypothetical protein